MAGENDVFTPGRAPLDETNRRVVPAPDPRLERSLLPFLQKKMEQGLRCCLVTLIAKKGSAPRPLGSQMAVSEDGNWLGYLTGGCGEAAIAAQAAEDMANAQNYILSLGENAPYKDIKLPCGASLDLFFDFGLSSEIINQLQETLISRRSADYLIDQSAFTTSWLFQPKTSDPRKQFDHIFVKHYHPNWRLIIAGRGPIFSLTADIAVMAGYNVHAFSPDPESLNQIIARDCKNLPLIVPGKIPALTLDPYCAGLLLFHDHEWELGFLRQFLTAPVFYCGALGSRKTHEARKHNLLEMGIEIDQLETIDAPIGLSLGSKQPQDIAIAILAQLVKARAKL